jgi:hypothetical protein
MRAYFFIAAALVCGILFWAFSPRHADKQTGNFDTATRFYFIGNAILRYSQDHENNPPKKLSDLIPGYIGSNQLSFFYPTALLDRHSPSFLKEWNSRPNLVDTDSDCVYIGAKGISNEVIAYEREGASNRTSSNELYIIPPMGGADRVTKLQLDQLLHSDASEMLERMRKERVTYYEANLHASLNGYRIDLGTYPRGDNSAMTRILRGDNSKKESYHSSYEQERNLRGEELDPWGTPYFIESDGNRVKIKSAGPNRKFDEVSSSGYDDICFTVAGGNTSGNDTKF